jgi:FkbM family methyltransferase
MADLDITMRPNSNVSLALLQQHGFVANTVIDIGAAEGAFFLYRRAGNLFPGARHFFVDAMRENEPGYRKLAAKFGSGYEVTALSTMEGEITMRVDPDFYNTHVEHLQPGTGYEELRRVPVSTLDSVVRRHSLKPPFVLKLDVQGGELDVLRGGLSTLEDAVVVTTEIQIFPPRDSLVDLLGFMHGIGWALYDITDLSYYPTDSTFYQCYATFIPKSMDFRGNSEWCSAEQKPGILEQLRARRLEAMKAIEELTG